jgi:ribosome maturation factor RimP
MELGEKIRQLAELQLADMSQFVVSVSVSSLQGPQKVTVILDGDKGITIDDCASLSRALLSTLEEKGMVGENFTLEVTTPGLDRPLKLKRQFFKNIGRGLQVQLVDKTILRGKLEEVTEEAITLGEIAGEKKNEEQKAVLPFRDIEKAYVQILFK